MVILCTDHGHYLGEKDLWGKPRVMQYEPLGHTPLLVSFPSASPGEIEALTTNVDLHATLADFFDVSSEHATHGQSLLPLITGEKTSVREYALGGIYGNWVQINDGKHKYARGPVGDNFPLSMFSNRWSTMPVPSYPGLRLPVPDQRARLDTMPGSSIPVIRQPFEPGDLLPFWTTNMPIDEHYLFDIEEDPTEDNNLVGTQREQAMLDALRTALGEIDAPTEQLTRLGL